MAAVTLVDLKQIVRNRGKNEEQTEDFVTAHVGPHRKFQIMLVSLADPGNDINESLVSCQSECRHHEPNLTRDYLLVSNVNSASRGAKEAQDSCDIFEVQSVLPNNSKYASYFVGSRVISNPSFHVSTRVDPLFFALAHFQRIGAATPGGRENRGKKDKWVPWDQMLLGLPVPVLRSLNVDPAQNLTSIDEVGPLGHLLDLRIMCGDDSILCKLSQENVMKWLLKKYQKVVDSLRLRLIEKKKLNLERTKDARLSDYGGGSGAFCTSFGVTEEERQNKQEDGSTMDGGTLAAEKKSMLLSLSEEEEHLIRVSGIQLLCDYLPTYWKNKLANETGLDESDWMAKRKATCDSQSLGTDGNTVTMSNRKRSRTSWEGNPGQFDADMLLSCTLGTGKGLSTVTPPGNKIQKAQTAGTKKLAMVNKKGMKSISSFFGPSKKKK